MDETKRGRTRARLRDQCFALTKLLSQKNRISISEISETLKCIPPVSEGGFVAFSCAMDLRIEKGIVIIERN